MFKQHDPAPVPADDLAASLAPFGSSRMLPREAYVDPAVFEWEQRNVFAGWTCVGHASDMAGVGTQRAIGSGANAMLLVNGDDGIIRAFANTCRHRGHELLECGATTKRRGIVCPYHSWSYRLDGTLRNAPGFDDGFSTGDFGLTELRLVNWHGWLFADASGTDVDFADHVAGLEDVVGGYRPEDLVIVDRHSYELATNWKVIAENYQECYHCSTIHPELSKISPPTSGENLHFEGSWMGGWMSMIEGAETMSFSGRSGGVAIKGLSERELSTVMYLVGFPNLLVSLHPDYVMTHVMTPLSADRTHVECAWAFPKDVAAQEDFDPSYAVDFWDLVNRQDWAMCERVQAGISSRVHDRGYYSPMEDYSLDIRRYVDGRKIAADGG